MIAAKNGHLPVVEVQSFNPCLLHTSTLDRRNMNQPQLRLLMSRTRSLTLLIKFSEMVGQVLISWGANVDAQSYTNNTPLLWATRERHETVVEALILSGTSYNISHCCKKVFRELSDKTTVQSDCLPRGLILYSPFENTCLLWAVKAFCGGALMLKRRKILPQLS